MVPKLTGERIERGGQGDITLPVQGGNVKSTWHVLLGLPARVRWLTPYEGVEAVVLSSKAG
jgi:hypothetical protein